MRLIPGVTMREQHDPHADDVSRGKYEHDEHDVRLERLVASGNGHNGALLDSHYSPRDLGRAQSVPARDALGTRPGTGDTAAALRQRRDQRGRVRTGASQAGANPGRIIWQGLLLECALCS